MFGPVFLCVFTLSCFVLPVNGQYNSYSSYNSYNSGQYQNYPEYPTTCNDLQCSPNECCVETHRAPVCVALKAGTTGNQLFCARYKKCADPGDCPATAPCCVQALEPTFAKTCPRPQNYGSGYGLGYDSSYGYGSSYGSSYGYENEIDKTPLREGYCRASYDTGELCYLPLPGSEIANCPCKGALKCDTKLQPFVAGVCVA
ncbi:uncharacterized protein LOC106068370 [Biomphalaria glabrata]|uniref:Uncharacterized protein LOC106068370 n=1 Tax=Biomphalaria glabrata TaxID=6526 RepID=A0A9U8ED34_BIOGL|nr:uncharacterized protein LOC106068370 [Biomphalaria glabrata]